MATLSTKAANDMLPQEPTKTPVDPRRAKYLLIGPPKWGKTTLGCSVPDSLLLATEEGHMFQEAHKIIIDSWGNKLGPGHDDDNNLHLSMEEAVETICASDRFQFIVIDTADMAAKMCLDYHYKKFGASHAEDVGTYGKGWDLCLTQPFRRQIGALMKSGRGIMFITHTSIVTRKVGQSEQSRAETTLPSQVQKFLHTQADLILHGNFGKLRKGMRERDRIISLDGTNEILAGTRVRGVALPKKFIVDPNDPWGQWETFFKDPKAAAKAEEQFKQLVLSGHDTGVAAEPTAATISEPLDGDKEKGGATPAAERRSAAAKKTAGRR
jgi:hypothetical protein